LKTSGERPVRTHIHSIGGTVPDWQVAATCQAIRSQELLIHPDSIDFRSADCLAVLEKFADRKVSQIPNIDNLDRVTGSAGPEHFATFARANRPVGKTVSVIARTANIGRLLTSPTVSSAMVASGESS
jgi:hypothetical protein